MTGTMGLMVVSPDRAFAAEVRDILQWQDAPVFVAASPRQAVETARLHPLGAVVFDARSAGDDNLAALLLLRRHTSAPVVTVTNGDSELAGECLELGAADCVGWPVSPRELRARVRLRAEPRTGNGDASTPGLLLDHSRRTVTVNGSEAVELTDREFELLGFMATSPGVPFSADQLLDAVWGSSRHWQTVGTIREHIYRLRKKLERDPSRPSLIVTERGRGYKVEV